jgi:hypothetical protein
MSQKRHPFIIIHLGDDLEELNDAAVSALRRVNAELKQHWSVIGWVTTNLLSRTPLCFGKHVKPLVSVAFAGISTHQSALGPRGGLWPVLLCVIHKACAPGVGSLIG